MSLRPVDVSRLEPLDPVQRARPDLVWVPISELVIDEAYQRPLQDKSWRQIREMAAVFDWAKFGACLIAPAGDGRWALIDGQHRTHAALLAGEAKVPCLAVNVSREEAARAFADVNSVRTGVSVFGLYRAARAAGELWAMRLAALETDTGVRIAQSNVSAVKRSGRTIYALGLLRKWASGDEYAVLRRAVEVGFASRHGAGKAIWSADCLGPWLGIVRDLGGVQDAALVQALDKVDFDAIERAVDALRDDTRFRAHTRKYLREVALRGKVRQQLGLSS